MWVRHRGAHDSWLARVRTEADLAAATAPEQRKKVPWVIATSHYPIYSPTMDEHAHCSAAACESASASASQTSSMPHHAAWHGTARQGREGTQHTRWPSKLPLPSFLLRTSKLVTVSTDESIEGEIANPTAVYRTCEENGEVRPGCDH